MKVHLTVSVEADITNPEALELFRKDPNKYLAAFSVHAANNVQRWFANCPLTVSSTVTAEGYSQSSREERG